MNGGDESPPYLAGILLAMAGASLWGISGTAAQALFERGLSAESVTAARLVLGAALAFALARPLLPPAGRWGRLVCVGAGLGAAQYLFFASVAASDVATASFIQYLSVPLVTVYEAAAGRLRLTWPRLLTVACALAGAGLLVTGGRHGVAGLSVTGRGLAFGLLCAASIAFYSLTSAPLVRTVGVWTLTAWGSLLGSLPLLVIAPLRPIEFSGSLAELLALGALIIVLGTCLGTGCYFASLRLVTATEAGVATTVEPIAATLTAFAFLGVLLSTTQYLGGLLILAAVVLLALLGRAQPARR